MERDEKKSSWIYHEHILSTIVITLSDMVGDPKNRGKAADVITSLS